MIRDIEAIVKNCRQSGRSIRTEYRPCFDIHKDYSTTGVIYFLDSEKELKVNEETKCLISFLSPEVYPKSLWVGKKIVFKEGNNQTGYAIVTKILNGILKSDVDGIEGKIKL